MIRPLALALLGSWAGLACASAIGLPNDDASELPPVADDSCARFGFQFTAGGCPEAECAKPLCSCLANIRCIRGKNERCMSAVDCNVACGVDPETLFSCSIEIKPCRVDADCEDERCVTEAGAKDGECESGERGARCRDDQDCKVGNCVAGNGGNRACSPGEESDLCNRAADCQSQRCALAPAAATGTCDP